MTVRYFAIIVIILCICQLDTRAQKKFSCPLKKGTMEAYNFDSLSSLKVSQPSAIIEITGKSSKVFSISDGKVLSIKRVNGIYLVLIQTEDFYITIDGMNSVSVEEGEIIKQKHKIGLTQNKRIALMLSKGNIVQRQPQKYLACNIVNPF